MKLCNPDEQRIKNHLAQLDKTLSHLEFQLKVYEDKTLPDAATMTAHFNREVRETKRAIEKLERELTTMAEETAQRATESVKPKGLLASADQLQAQTDELMSEVLRKKDARRDLESESTTLKVQC